MNGRRRLWLVATTLVTAVALSASPGTAGGAQGPPAPPGCRVWNPASGPAGSDLQAAIDAADSGDLLVVRGVCAGHFRIDKDLRLLGPARLDGATCQETYCRHVVLSVDAGRVVLRAVRIVNGLSTFTGGGIQNAGTLILSGSSSVTASEAEDGGGGIWNEGTLVMTGSSSVSRNGLTYNGWGGGIWNVGTLVMDHRASVTANSAQQGGGVYNEGTLILRRWASVTGNSAEVGGGVLDVGTLELGPRWHGTLCGNDPDDGPGCVG